MNFKDKVKTLSGHSINEISDKEDKMSATKNDIARYKKMIKAIIREVKKDVEINKNKLGQSDAFAVKNIAGKLKDVLYYVNQLLNDSNFPKK